MDDTLDRVQASTAVSEAFAFAAEFFGSMPVVKAHTLLVMPGQGERSRVDAAVREWERRQHSRLLIAGINPKEKTFEEYTHATLAEAPYRLRFNPDRVTVQLRAGNTLDQAEWAVDRIVEYGLREQDAVAVIATWYHAPRAYLTVLKSLRKRKLRIGLLPMWVSCPPADNIPEPDQHGAFRTYRQSVPGEWMRILKYKNDVASLAELREHIDWMHSVLR